MSFAKVYSAQAQLLSASMISIEADLSRGLHSFSIVGLPDKAIEEAKDRISAAIKNSGFPSPKSKNHRVILSLAPADLKKEGPSFDVPLALAYLLAAGEINFNPENKLFLGELSLNGQLRPIVGVLSLTREAQKRGFKEIYIPYDNAQEAALISNIKVYGIKTFLELLNHLSGKTCSKEFKLLTHVSKTTPTSKEVFEIDISDIQGQEHAKRALEIAASGGHNCALYGPPGTGKTMLAKSFATILPDLTYDQLLDVISIYSVARLSPDLHNCRPPFRAPHHTSSYAAIIGGGTHLKPGELTLAHNGILFLDEFAEFDRRVIDSLRQPLEDRTITISRQKGTVTFPAHCILLIAFNPCPCGNSSSKEKICTCSQNTINRYQKKISGPIIDRIDLWSHVQEINRTLLVTKQPDLENNITVRKRIEAARKIQSERFQGHIRNITLNSDMNTQDLANLCVLEVEAKKILLEFSEKLKLSMRSHHRVIKIARTIADLSNKEKIDCQSILEALQYRPQF